MGHFQSSMSYSRYIRPKLGGTVRATIMTRVFAKAVRSPKCTLGKHCFSNPKHLSITHSMPMSSIVAYIPAFFGLRIGVNKYA